ncbi:MAG: MFS transporter [Treponema sp.]|nr:MFS transporter [Treponema sp.]MCL2138929.1 MFS transporter [Treponema sp.]
MKKVFAGSSYALFVNGIMVLMIGSIMPALSKEYNIDYYTEGIFLALRFAGTMLSGFLVSILMPFFGRKKTTVFLSLFIGLSFLGIIATGYVPVLLIMFFLLGLGTGSVNYITTALVNEMAVGKASYLNVLHTSFAVGAFLGPLIAALVYIWGGGWKISALTGIAFSASVFFMFCKMRIADPPKKAASNGAEEKTLPEALPFYKNSIFYLSAFVLFFYLGAETSVNGWLVTYLIDEEIMSDSYAKTLLGILWLVIMAGRLFCAWLSTRFRKTLIILFNSLGAALMFLLFFFSKDQIILTVILLVFGFCFAGIYPTAISVCGKIISRSHSAMAILLAIAGLGGIMSPYIVGFTALIAGMTAGMAVIIVFNVLTVLFALALKIRCNE